jgi:hypothetical protein
MRNKKKIKNIKLLNGLLIKKCFFQENLLNSVNNNDIHTAEYIETIVFGLNLKYKIIEDIIKNYYEMVELGLPFLSIFPEEIVLSSLFNKVENKKILYKNPEQQKLQINEKNMNIESAVRDGYFFLHTNYKKYAL